MKIQAYVGYVPSGEEKNPESYGYGEDQPLRRAAFLLRERVCRRELEAHRGERAELRLAHALSAYLLEKDIVLDEGPLAGFFLQAGAYPSWPLGNEQALWLEKDGLLKDPADRRDLSLYQRGARARLAGCGMGGHIVVGYEKLLRLGLGGLREEAEASLLRDDTPTARAALLLLQSISKYFLRVSYEASRKGKGRLARAMEKLSAEPPSDFFEAVQLYCIWHEIVLNEQQSGSLSLGRLDKILYPFYKKELEAGTIARQEAYALLEAFWKKFINMGASIVGGYQNVTLGGVDEEGEPVYNDITRMALELSYSLRNDQPFLSLRVNAKMPRDLWPLILDLMGTGIGFPSLFNDEVAIAAKARVGCSERDARDYAIVGCVELSIPGKEFSHTEGTRLNWALILDMMLHGGSTMSGERFDMEGRLEDIQSFDALKDWYKREARRFLDIVIRGLSLFDKNYAAHWPNPFASLSMDDCLQKGLDVAGGGARYNNFSINNVGMANVVDSLLSMKKWVFEEKRFGLSDIARMTEQNFAGNEAARRFLWSRCPHFGSDPEAAELMRELTEDLSGALRGRVNPRGGKYQLGFYSVDAQGYCGEMTRALPDGRKAGESLANGFNPVQGTEKAGPTEVILASTRTDHALFGNGMVTDMKFPPAMFLRKESRARFVELIKTYMDLGGMQMQINAVDKETLLKAQRNPELYQNLIVRVSGFSAYFVSLTRPVQDEIIRRTSFDLN